ncbi:hypothetical protein HGM15179_009173 [Zosterops borbonicus]|uniref:Uncharacterized protein n=1 Tax=Zosterops borbonicus TaxID=364589 RepID=A0A8K1GHC5_9PASS|nr:hypothetical protein HGM15179_009173 [Zosterops borbonicus]
MGSRWGLTTAEQGDRIPSLSLLPFVAVQDVFGFLGCECPSLGPVQPVTHQHPQPSPSGQGCSDLFIPHTVLIPGLAPAQVQHLEHGHIKLPEIPMGSFPERIQVHLVGIPSLRSVIMTIQLGDICKFFESALDLFIYVTHEEIK